MGICKLTTRKKILDTGDLLTEAYKAIIIEAEEFNHDLALHFGVVADSCKNEKEYNLSKIFFRSPPDKKHLHLTFEKY